MLALAGLRWMYLQQAALPAITEVVAQELAAPDSAHIEEDGWAPLSLPDKICSADCNSQYKIYRSTLPGGAPDQPAAIYLPMFDGAAKVLLNGRTVGQSGSMRDPIADMTYQPMLLGLPQDLFAPDANTLDVIVSAQVRHGGRLIPFHVGSAAELESAFRTVSFLSVDILAVINGIFVVLGFCALLLYASGDRDRLYLWFVLILVFSAARNLNILWPEWPATLASRNWIYLTATLGVLLSTSGLVSRFAMRQETRIDIALVLLLIPAAVLFGYGLSTDLVANWIRANALIRVVGIILVPYALIRFLLHARSLPVTVHSVIFALLTAGLVLVLHDIVQSWPPRRLVFQLSNLAALPIVLSFCVTLVSRYAGHLAAIKAHNRELREAVAARERELAKSHERETEQARRQALGDERQRIMRDMHDGVAGRLAVMVQQLRHGAPAEDALTDQLQRSLQELRLTIDSLDEELGVDFEAALESFRARAEPVAAEQGVQIRWVSNLDEKLALGPEKTLQIYRCLQEGVHNVLQHAEASTVTVAVSRSDGQLDMTVSDNGTGIAAPPGNGRGLLNMRQRIESIGGTLEISSDSGGTRLQFLVPLDPP